MLGTEPKSMPSKSSPSGTSHGFFGWNDWYKYTPFWAIRNHQERLVPRRKTSTWFHRSTKDWGLAPEEHRGNRKLPLGSSSVYRKCSLVPRSLCRKCPSPSSRWTPPNCTIAGLGLTTGTARLWRSGLLTPVASFRERGTSTLHTYPKVLSSKYTLNCCAQALV